MTYGNESTAYDKQLAKAQEALAIAEHRIRDQDRLIGHLRILKGEMAQELNWHIGNAKAQAERIRELEAEVEAKTRAYDRMVDSAFAYAEAAGQRMRYPHDPSDLPVSPTDTVGRDYSRRETMPDEAAENHRRLKAEIERSTDPMAQYRDTLTGMAEAGDHDT